MGHKSSLLLLKDYMIWENKWLYKQEQGKLSFGHDISTTFDV